MDAVRYGGGYRPRQHRARSYRANSLGCWSEFPVRNPGSEVKGDSVF